MSDAGRIAFNLAVNAAGSFVVAAGLVWVASKALRLREGRWTQALLALPLVKVVYDLGRGIPSDGFFWQTLDGTRQDLGTFQIGLGIERGIPVVHLSLGALLHEKPWPQSLAEPLASGLVRRVSPHAPGAIAGGLLLISLVLVGLRVVRAARSLLLARRLRRDARVIETLPLGLRSADVVVSPRHLGAPFAAGLFRPFVCFPADVYAALDEEERAAVVGHEIGHLRHHDLLAFAVLALFADVFWFVPGLRARCRTLRAHAEIAADQVAIARGAAPTALASALVRVGELCAEHASARTGPTPSLALITGNEPASLLARRVHGLLLQTAPSAKPASRFATFARAAGLVWATLIVLRAATLGNHLPAGALCLGFSSSAEILQP